MFPRLPKFLCTNVDKSIVFTILFLQEILIIIVGLVRYNLRFKEVIFKLDGFLYLNINKEYIFSL